jgi:hypothetical protein
MAKEIAGGAARAMHVGEPVSSHVGEGVSSLIYRTQDGGNAVYHYREGAPSHVDQFDKNGDFVATHAPEHVAFPKGPQIVKPLEGEIITPKDIALVDKEAGEVHPADMGPLEQMTERQREIRSQDALDAEEKYVPFHRQKAEEARARGDTVLAQSHDKMADQYKGAADFARDYFAERKFTRRPVIDIGGQTTPPTETATPKQLAPPPAAAQESRAAADPLVNRIHTAYLDASGGKLGQRVWLSDLRAKLSDVPRTEVDDALRKMHLEEGSQLSTWDNPSDLTPERKAASVDFKGTSKDALIINQIPGKETPGEPTPYKTRPSLHTSKTPELYMTPHFMKRDPDNPSVPDTSLAGMTSAGNDITYFYAHTKPIIAMESKEGRLIKRYRPDDIQFPHAPIEIHDVDIFDKDKIREAYEARSDNYGPYSTISKLGERMEPVDKIHAAISERIRSIAGDPGVYVIPSHLMPIEKDRDPLTPGAAGVYIASHHSILVDSGIMKEPGMFNETILHEGVHASIDHAMMNNLHIATAVREVAKATRDSLGEHKWKNIYASSTPREFMTESLSNPTLRDHLIGIRTTPAVKQAIIELERAHGVPPSPIQNMWDAVKAVTRRVFMIKPNEESLFDSILKISSHAEHQLQKTPAGSTPWDMSAYYKHIGMMTTMEAEPGLWQTTTPVPTISPRQHLDDMMKSMETTPVDKR